MVLSYGGGPLLTHALTLFPLYYGEWNASHVQLVQNLLAGLAATPLWTVVAAYTDGHGAHATSTIRVAPPQLLGTPYGTDWGTTDYSSQIVTTFTGGRRANGSNLPMVLVAPDVVVPHWGTDMCGYHSEVDGQAYVFSGDSGDRSCAFDANILLKPASTLVHELAETVTDPYGTGWISETNDEVGDLCDWQLVPLPGAPNGYYETNGTVWNLKIDKDLFLVQSLWDNRANACSFGTTPPPPPAVPGKHKPPPTPVAPAETPTPAPAPTPKDEARKTRSLVGTCFAVFFLVCMSGTSASIAVMQRGPPAPAEAPLVWVEMNPMWRQN